MTFECEISEQAPQPVLSIRTRTAVEGLPQLVGQVYGRIAQYLNQLGEQPAGPPFAAYYDMNMQNLDVELGFPVARPLAGQGDIQANQIPGGKIASCLHVGPYTELGSAYSALSQWVTEQGQEATGVAYEFYLNDPQQTAPEALMTRIAFPLKGK